jgi:hypothetical protein
MPKQQQPNGTPGKKPKRHRSTDGWTGPFQLWWKCSSAVSLDRLMRLIPVGVPNSFLGAVAMDRRLDDPILGAAARSAISSIRISF